MISASIEKQFGDLFIALVAFTLVLLAACSPNDGKRPIRDFYFPVENLNGGRVYEYETTQNGNKTPEYWYYRTFPRDSGFFMAATNYDHQFQIVQIRREKIVETGVQARDYFLYEPDTASGKLKQIQARIESADLFPFRVTDSLGVFLFRLKYHPVGDSASTNYVIRNRRYLGDGPAFHFQDKDYPCIRFGIREVVGNEKEGAWEAEGLGEEWYAKGLGLVYFRKNYNKGQLIIESRLKDQFSMKELEKRAGVFFNQSD
jgi:hypothetical protein